MLHVAMSIMWAEHTAAAASNPVHAQMFNVINALKLNAFELNML